MKLSTEKIDVRPLQFGYFDGYACGAPKGKMTSRTVYDYEMEFYTRSDGGIFIDGRFVPFRKGEINIRKPGQRVCGYNPYSCYIVCFTADGRTEGKETGYEFGTADYAEPCYDNPLLNSLPDRLAPRSPEHFAALFSALAGIAGMKDDFSRFRARCLTSSLLCEVLDEVRRQQAGRSAAQRRIAAAVDAIRADCCAELSVSGLIRASGLSRAYFHRCFRQYTGTTPEKLILTLRMEKAKSLLVLTDRRVADIASACGYGDSAYFTRLFRKSEGVTPGDYRKSRSPR